mmetsp:Transcript_31169/g.99371  ORF Transcript_31169/g.99371 Transcript_31169/m.99371 type:complete len:125 (-) Transcript_31169:85-459(-)
MAPGTPEPGCGLPGKISTKRFGAGDSCVDSINFSSSSSVLQRGGGTLTSPFEKPLRLPAPRATLDPKCRRCPRWRAVQAQATAATQQNLAELAPSEDGGADEQTYSCLAGSTLGEPAAGFAVAV